MELFDKEVKEPQKINLGVKDITAEEVRSTYFDKDALVEPSYTLYRLNSKGGDRFYYRYDQNKKSEFFISVTTFIKKSLGISPFLMKWYADMGAKEADRYVRERASYGTLMHTQIEQLTIDRKYDLDNLHKVIKEHLEFENRGLDLLEDWYHEMKKDILSWAQFMIEYNVKPIAIEVMLCHPMRGYAGAIDLVCEMDVEVKGFFGEVYKSGARMGEPKESKQIQRIKAIVDAKSGKKGFFEAHEIQLHAYKDMFEYNYPDMKIDRVYNWSGAAWKTTPTFKLKDQTNAKSQHKLPELLKIAEIENSMTVKPMLLMEGIISLDDGIDGNIRSMTKEELVEDAI